MNAKATLVHHRWASLPFLLGGGAIPILDFFAINMILPTIRADRGLDAVATQLVVSAFSGLYAVLLITGSRLGDLWGRRRLFVLGALGFAVASALAAWSPSVEVLLGARALAGAAAALFVPQVLASIVVQFPAEERPRALGWLGTAFSLASVVGTVLGGLLIAWHPWGLTWQALFLAYVPLGLSVALGGLRLVESRNEHAQGLDWGGVGLIVLALGLLIFPLAEGRAAGWPPLAWVLLALSPVAWAGFFVYEARLEDRGGSPLVSSELLRNGPFRLGLALSLLLYIAYGFLLCTTLFLKATHGLTALEAGLANLPFALAFFAVSFFVSPVARRLGALVLPVGFGLMAVGWGLMIVSVARGGAGIDGLGLVGMAVAGAGNGLVQPSLLRVATSTLGPRHAGQASGVLLSVQQMAGALAVVVLGGVYFSLASTDPTLGYLVALSTSAFLGLTAAVALVLVPRGGRV